MCSSGYRGKNTHRYLPWCTRDPQHELTFCTWDAYADFKVSMKTLTEVKDLSLNKSQQVSQSREWLVWLAAYCWGCGGVEEGWTYSQDVASLPSLRGSWEESSVPFNFFYLCCVCKGHIPRAWLQLVLFFLCCLPHSQLEGQENRSGKLVHVCHRWLREVPGVGSLMPGSTELSSVVPWGQG